MKTLSKSLLVLVIAFSLIGQTGCFNRGPDLDIVLTDPAGPGDEITLIGDDFENQALSFRIFEAPPPRVEEPLHDRQMSPDDVSRLLGISPQTVRSSKHKAIQRLREYVASEDSS